MQSTLPQPALLMLADGTTFYGKSFGANGTSMGEICFNTGMTGYQEVLTDPSYTGQMLILNHAHIGNYGIHHAENESKTPTIKGLISRNLEQAYSRQQANQSLETWLYEHGIIGITNVDTRALVTYIREKGAMNALISTELVQQPEQALALLQDCPDMSGLELAATVSTKQPYQVGNPNWPLKIAALDFGIKQNILNCFTEREIFVQVFPAHTPFNQLQAINPNGYFLSNGPGDPAAMPYAVETIQQMLASNKPIFGICLGHQLLALALGINTYKLKNGHRGINHPVKNVLTGICEITSQNHGFGIVAEDVAKHPDVEITHINLNDNTIEGIRLKSKPVFSVQYHPEASAGPHDSRYLFDDFKQLIQQA